MKKAMISALPDLGYAGSEAFNTVCSNLMFSGKNIKTIVITSVEPNDGKTFASMHVALNMAKRGKKVLLVDADLRLSQMNARYGIELIGFATGMAHYLSGQCALEEALYETNIPNIFLLPIGRTVQAPLSLIATTDFSDMIQTVRQTFDFVIIDAPPVGLVIDAAEIAKSCDGSILVLTYSNTHVRALREAKQQMERTGTPILGCVLNKVPLERITSQKYKYGKYGYYSYSQQHEKH